MLENRSGWCVVGFAVAPEPVEPVAALTRTGPINVLLETKGAIPSESAVAKHPGGFVYGL